MQLLGFYIYAMDVGAITRFLHCMRWMWAQLLGVTLYAMDVGALTRVLHCM